MRKSFNSTANFKALLIMMLAVFFSCNTSGKEEGQLKDGGPSWVVTIKGKVGNPIANGRVVIQQLSESSTDTWQDTIQVKGNGTFVKKVKISEPGYYRLNFYDRQVLNIILNKNDLEINVDGSNPQGFYEVKGSPDLELIRSVQERLSAVNNSPEVAKINQEYQVAVQQQNQAKVLALQQQYSDLVKREHDQIAILLETNSPSVGVINLLQGNTIDKDRYLPTYIKVADKLKSQWGNYTIAKNFIAQVDKMKVTAIGQPAPEIALPNPDGQIVKLSSFRGKYVLVDFWAKWCGPCRMENPNVVKAYNKFKDKGFTVFGVSLDRKKEDWLQAIEQDGLTWTHVSDLKYWQSEAAKLYNINSIPFSVLVDPNGIIVDKNLRGAALERRLAELLGDKKP